MNQELARKRPAQVVSPTVRRVVDLAAPTKKELMAALDRRSRAGEIERASHMRVLTEGRRAGWYAVRVVLVPPRVPSRWKRLWSPLAGVLLSLAVLVTALAWLLTALTGEALAMFLLAVLVAFLGWLKMHYRRDSSVVVTTSTSVHIR